MFIYGIFIKKKLNKLHCNTLHVASGKCFQKLKQMIGTYYYISSQVNFKYIS